MENNNTRGNLSDSHIKQVRSIVQITISNNQLYIRNELS